MASFKLNITSPREEFERLKSEIETLLNSGKQYRADFFLNMPSDDLLDNEENIIINAEYPLVGKILLNLQKSYANFEFGALNPNMHIVKWTVISQDDSE